MSQTELPQRDISSIVPVNADAPKHVSAHRDLYKPPQTKQMQLNTTAPTMAVPLDWKPGFRQLGSGAQLKPLWARDLHPLPRASRGFTNDLAGNHRLLRRLVATAFRCASSFTPHACWYSLQRNSFSFSYHTVLSLCWCSCAGRSRQINSPGCSSVPFLSLIYPAYADQSLATTCSHACDGAACTLLRHRYHRTEVHEAY
jgi:hypothetical protein